MKHFLIVEEQDGGCDYTIGCGIRVTSISAENLDAAIEQYEKDMLETHIEFDGTIYSNPWTAEGAPQRAQIYEYSAGVVINIEGLAKKADKLIEASKQADIEKEERAELVRLQEKYNK